jgi:hypothetical protein
MKEALEKAIEAKEHAASRFIRDDIPAPANLRSKRQSRNKTRIECFHCFNRMK